MTIPAARPDLGPRLTRVEQFPPAHEYVYVSHLNDKRIDVIPARSHDDADRIRAIAQQSEHPARVFVSPAKPGPNTLGGDYITFHLRDRKSLY